MTKELTDRYMLDTNMVSHLIKGVHNVRNKVISVPISDLSISAITEGELEKDKQ
jgi:predicted nucleic acid-binding protein